MFFRDFGLTEFLICAVPNIALIAVGFALDRQHKGDLARPASGFWYLFVAAVGVIVFSILPGLIIYGASASGLFSDNGVALVTTLGVILALLLLPAFWYFGTRGMYGGMSFYGFANLMVLSVLPIGGWFAVYYFGKGLYMAITRQSLLVPRSGSKAGAILIAIVVLVSTAIAVLSAAASSSPIPPTSKPLPTFAADPFLALTEAAAARDPTASCYRWDKVTTSMIGQQICAYGNVLKTRDVGESTTQVLFSSAPGSFFLAGGTHTYYVQPGDCVLAKGRVLRSGDGVPYIDIDEALYDCK